VAHKFTFGSVEAEHVYIQQGNKTEVSSSSFGPSNPPKESKIYDADLEKAKQLLGLIDKEIDYFINIITVDDFAAASFLTSKQKDEMVTNLRKLTTNKEIKKSAFFLKVFGDPEIQFGTDLLVPLIHTQKNEDPDWIKRFTRIFVLHEVLHHYQGLYSVNYQGIGRAGVVLEEMDYVADAFAISTSVLLAIRIDRISEKNPINLLKDYLHTALETMEAFDRSEQNGKIKNLAERRLRRYLIWTMHLARVTGVKKYDRLNDVQIRQLIIKFLEPRLVVQIAPLKMKHSDGRDQIIDIDNPQLGDSQPELFISINTKLIRVPSDNNFKIPNLLTLVCQYQWDLIADILGVVVTTHHGILIPQ
jgi:hypothetical protein